MSTKFHVELTYTMDEALASLIAGLQDADEMDRSMHVFASNGGIVLVPNTEVFTAESYGLALGEAVSRAHEFLVEATGVLGRADEVPAPWSIGLIDLAGMRNHYLSEFPTPKQSPESGPELASA